MKSILIRSLLLTFLTACAVEQSKFEGIPTSSSGLVSRHEHAEAPASSPGDFWMFRLRENNYHNYTSNTMGGDYRVVYSGGGRPEIFQLEEGREVRVNRGGQLLQMLPTGAVRRSGSGPQFFQFPLFVGKRWRDTFQLGTRWSTAENSVTGIETVTTPAGVLRAFKIERHIVRDLGLRTYWRYTYFYSPETRSVVKYLFEREIFDVGTEHTTEIELVKFVSAKKPEVVREEKIVSAPLETMVETEGERQGLWGWNE